MCRCSHAPVQECLIVSTSTVFHFKFVCCIEERLQVHKTHLGAKVYHKYPCHKTHDLIPEDGSKKKLTKAAEI